MSSAMSGGQFAAQKAKAADLFAGVENPMDTATGGGRKGSDSLIGASAALPALETDEERSWEAADIREMEMSRRSAARIGRATQAGKQAARREELSIRRESGGGATNVPRGGPGVLGAMREDGDNFRARRSAGTNGRTPAMVANRDYDTVNRTGGDMFDDANLGVDTAGTAPRGAIHNTDVDPADSRPSIKVTGGSSGQVNASPSSFENRAANRPGYAEGKMYVEAAGRCNHMRCQLLREKGLSLMGVHNFQGVGTEATLPEIPSVPVDETYYGTDPVTGKQNRKDVRTSRTYKVADPTHPEWVARGGNARSNKAAKIPGATLETNPEAASMVAANPDLAPKNPQKPTFPAKGASAAEQAAYTQANLEYRQAKWESEFSDPTSLLQHHHFEGDDDFETNPMPWKIK
jgi:hypothetical protein